LGRGEGGRGRNPPFFTSPSFLLSGEGIVRGERGRGGKRRGEGGNIYLGFDVSLGFLPVCT